MAGKKLLIVESPAKAGTIKKYLGRDYTVVASMGHIIDLPKSRIAIDFEHGFKPEYITIRGKGALLAQLKKEAAKADVSVIPYEEERTLSLKQALNGRKPQTVSIIIGPEGGFEKEETEFAAECGIKPVTLGKRILRTETAPLAVSAAVLYEFDEME